MIISYIAALWCAGYFVFQVVEVVRLKKLISEACLEFSWCGIVAPVTAFALFVSMYDWCIRFPY